MLVQMAALNCLTVMVTAFLTLNITVISQEVKIDPIQYASLFPNTFNEGGYMVSHIARICTSSSRRINSRSVPIINCSRGEGVLLDGLTQPNINRRLTDEAIQAFGTWTDRLSTLNHTFITLQFSDEPIIARAVVYCLVLQDLKIREPKKFQLFSSTTETVYPVTEIMDVNDPEFTMPSTGRTIVRRSGDDDNDDDDDIIYSNYEYRKYEISIPRDRQIPLNFLRISMDFNGDNWIFISEVEAYRMEQLNLTTSANGDGTTTSAKVAAITTAVSMISVVSMTTMVSMTTVISMTTAMPFSTQIKEPFTITISSSTTLEQNAKSSNNMSVFVIAVVATAASISLILCIIILICVIACLRKKRNNLLVSTKNIIPSVLHAYETVDNHKCSVENIYEKVNTTDCSTREQKK